MNEKPPRDSVVDLDAHRRSNDPARIEAGRKVDEALKRAEALARRVRWTHGHLGVVED